MENLDSQTATAASLACSKSCTRAGILAIALSLLAIVLIPSLEKWGELTSYADYINLRFELKSIVETLGQNMVVDKCWEFFISKANNYKDVNQ